MPVITYCESCEKCGKECGADPTTEVNGCMSYVPRDMEGYDPVNHPNHYTCGDIECIEAIRASMEPMGFQDYCKGNVLKYIWRWRYKGGLEDLKKAQVYLNWMVESVETDS